MNISQAAVMSPNLVKCKSFKPFQDVGLPPHQLHALLGEVPYLAASGFRVVALRFQTQWLKIQGLGLFLRSLFRSRTALGLGFRVLFFFCRSFSPAAGHLGLGFRV